MNPSKPPLRHLPIFMLIFISMFGFIGVAVLIFLWAPSSDGFGAPPLFFRVFGSFIALAFIWSLRYNKLHADDPDAPAPVEVG